MPEELTIERPTIASPEDVTAFFTALDARLARELEELSVVDISRTDLYEEADLRWTGRKNGISTQVSSWMKDVPAEYKKDFGRSFNLFKSNLDLVLKQAKGR